MSFLVLGAPCSNNVSQMTAFVLDLSIIAHGDKNDGDVVDVLMMKSMMEC